MAFFRVISHFSRVSSTFIIRILSSTPKISLCANKFGLPLNRPWCDTMVHGCIPYSLNQWCALGGVWSRFEFLGWVFKLKYGFDNWSKTDFNFYLLPKVKTKLKITKIILSRSFFSIENTLNCFKNDFLPLSQSNK